MYIKNIKEYKIGLRANFRKKRENMVGPKKQILDKRIRNNLYHTKEYRRNRLILTYVSKEIEVDTLEIIKMALKNRKIVAVPRCITETKTMEFYRITSLRDLHKGTFGVLEPIVERCKIIKDFSNGLCIVPGFAFDNYGYRLGYGQGYYDRFLSNFLGDTVGICYSNCTKPKLPHGYYDRPVDVLVTDKFIRTIRK